MTKPDPQARLRALLAATAELEPSPALDRRVRALLRATPRARSLPRPFVAAGVGVAGLLAGGAGLAIAFAEAGAAESGPLMALYAVTIYLAVSAAAASPLLLLPGLRRRIADGGAA